MTSRTRSRSRTSAISPSTCVSLDRMVGFSRIWCSDGSELSRISRSAGAERHHAGADFRPDGAAPARDENALAANEILQPRPVDLHRRAQQQVFDLERRQFGVAHAFARLVTRTSGRPRRRARAISMSGLASGAKALGVATRRRIGTPRSWKSCTTWSRSAKVPRTGTPRIDWPRSSARYDRMPMGWIFFTEPRFDARAASPRCRCRARAAASACWRRAAGFAASGRI